VLEGCVLEELCEEKLIAWDALNGQNHEGVEGLATRLFVALGGLRETKESHGEIDVVTGVGEGPSLLAEGSSAAKLPSQTLMIFLTALFDEVSIRMYCGGVGGLGITTVRQAGSQ